MGATHLTIRAIKTGRLFLITILLFGLSLGNIAPTATRAALPGLPFTEDFSDTSLRDSNLTNANWSTEEEALVLAWKRAQYGVFGASLAGSNISIDAHSTCSIAFGDMDGDGDLDLVVGNYGQTNRLYLNNGTTNFFNGVSGSDISTDTQNTRSVALGDMDGDGDLDLVAGNYGQTNRLYLNNGTANPFNAVSGSDISADAHDTYSVALGNLDGDGDLDLVVGNYDQANRLYLNNGTANPFIGVSGNDISTDANATLSVVLGDMDEDGDLDLLAGNFSQANRLYLNNGTADPFNGVSSSVVSADAHATRSLALGDVDGDGDLDLVTGNNSQVNRLYLNNGTVNPFDGISGSDISVDTQNTTSTLLGDVDGDGDLDVVVGNSGQPNRLYLNNGTVYPFDGISGSDVSTDTHSTYTLALGDLDRDGDLDLAAGNYGLSNRLYLNEGSGDSFNGESGSDISTDAHATKSLALGDMDGDGYFDLVAGNYNQANRLYLNNGTSDPFNGVSGSNISADTHNTIAVVLGDVDRDGDLDLLVGNSGQANRLYLNNGTSTPFSAVSGSDISADVLATRSMALGDVDGDGDPDLVTGNDGTNQLYLNNGTTDPFNGVSGVSISTDTHNTLSVAMGDVDRDGDLDLVAGNYGQTNRLYLNNGTVTPFNGVSGSDISADNHTTRSVALGDVDRDGNLDLVAGNYGQTNRLYLNNGTASPFSGVSGSDVSTDSHVTLSVLLGDVDGDGNLDLVAGNDGVNRLYLNNGTMDPFSGVSGSDISTDTHNTLSVALGDVDRDGDLDLVAGNWYQANRLYLNGSTTSPFNSIAGSDISTDTDYTYSLALGDVDGDGDLDLVAGNVGIDRLYLNNGTADPFGGVSGSDISTDVRNTYSVALGDMDGDGDLDLVTGNSFNQTNRLYLNNGTADPFGGVCGSDISTDTDYTYSLALGDVDRDGDLDVVAGNGNDQANRLYLNNGTTDPFSGVSSSDISTDTHATDSVVLGDVDRDGDLDLVAGNNGQVNRLYLNNGTADPFNSVSGNDISVDVHPTKSVALGDVDGDGDLDLVAGNNGNNRLYLNNGTASPFSGLSGSNICSDTNFTWAIALGDVDRDGDLDVVTGNRTQFNRVCLNNGTASPFSGVSSSNISSDVHDTTSIVLGHVDKDGDLDLVAGNVNQANRLYRRELYHTAQGWADSLRVDTETINISKATLTPLADLPINTGVTYWLSNNGGAQWFIVKPGVAFTFPTTGADLRWKAHLTSLSPILTPHIDQIVITGNQAPIANAGSDQNVSTDTLVTLDGSGSSDPDGDLPLTYYWTQSGGSLVMLSDPAAVVSTFTAPSDSTVLTFTLTITDSLGLPDPTPDEILVIVQLFHIYMPLIIR
ncbi:MAG: VCBS repeat-containing protein [Anaerolineales bacterium]|nr:VCBS repeat-containing protein [Anaerolineales bacterium]